METLLLQFPHLRIAVNSVPALQEQVGRYRPNDLVDVVLDRYGKQMTLKVALLGVDGSAEIVRIEDAEKELGSKFAVVTANDKQKLGGHFYFWPIDIQSYLV